MSSSLAAFAALSSPVGSKLLHLSPGLSAAAVGGGAEPFLQPKSHDMLLLYCSLSYSGSTVVIQLAHDFGPESKVKDKLPVITFKIE